MVYNLTMLLEMLEKTSGMEGKELPHMVDPHYFNLVILSYKVTSNTGLANIKALLLGDIQG